jgi:hypothetical protein
MHQRIKELCKKVINNYYVFVQTSSVLNFKCNILQCVVQQIRSKR